jgi:phosphopentomutase
MARAFLFVLDSFGVGHAPDAARFGDAGADTFGHIAAAVSGGLRLPVMERLGLAAAADVAAERRVGDGLSPGVFFGAAQEVSSGKDTPSGHWEIAGVPVPFDWGYFPQTVPTFPAALTAAIVREGGLPGILGDCHASGTEIIDRFGEEHIRTAKPICYTSADSVIQIAAHETHFGLERLYELCRMTRRLVDPLNIGRVIARPFLGEARGGFVRTGNRRDFAVPPPEPTLLDRLVARGSRVIGMGKIGDIFAHRGVSEVRKAVGNLALLDATVAAMEEAGDGDLVFANFVDFDTEFGHRRDVSGYAAALEAFDARLPAALARLRDGDLLLLTADHGCDPTWSGTDHTRERVPIFGVSPGRKGGPVGLRPTFADIGETVAAHLDLPPGRHGTSFLEAIAGRA